MRRASIAAAGFALVDGRAAEPVRSVHVAPAPDPFGRILLASVEPLESTVRGFELASLAMRVLRDTFVTHPGSAAEALLAAFAAANAAVVAENHPHANGRWSRRICVGATGIVLAGSDVVVAQAPPSQAILVQDGQIYPFPDVASWRGDYAAEGAVVESQPLGFADVLLPRIYQSEAAPGDLIALCSTSIGRALGREDDAAFELSSGRLLTDDLEGSIDRLERLLLRHEVVDAFAVLALVARLPRRSRLRGLAASRAAAPSERRVQRPAGAVPLLVSDNAHDEDPFTRVPPPAIERVRGAAIRATELATPARRATPTFAARQAVMAAPGALSVRRYRESSGIPVEWRANLPRGPMMHVPARLLAVSLVAFLALGGTGYAVERQRDREAQVAASLAAADNALRSAVENPLSASTLVAQAEAALGEAREAGASAEALHPYEEEMARVRDAAWDIQRLADVQRIGAIPAEIGAGSVHLAISGRTLYIAAGDLFELAPDEPRLVSLLAEGDPVSGGTAGQLRHVSIDGGSLVAFDGAAAYVRDKSGAWERRELALEAIGELRADVPVMAWGEAAYGVAWDGDIVRFEQSAGGPLADIWAAVAETPDLETARDLAIDGRIHVLLQDGRALTFSRGALTGTTTPFTVPVLKEAAFFAQAPLATGLYIVDPTTRVGGTIGRIVRVDAAGEARQFLMPEPFGDEHDAMLAANALSGVQDMAIDELSGTVYWVSKNEIWRATLPAA